MLERTLGLLACPSCAGAIAADGASYRCVACANEYASSNGIPNLRVPTEARSETVRAFYTVSPFPGYPPRDSFSGLRARAERSEFARLLDRAIPGDASIVELGCGTGQMSLFLSTADRVVIGADLTRASLELGAEASRRFQVDRVQFIETDLRTPGLKKNAFDVVYSSGVLHHTPDPRAAFASMVQLVKPGGILVLGLYNTYARAPHLLRRLIGRMTSYRYIPFDPILRDRKSEPARREAWLRDQYMHPEEHRHTLREVQRWFRANDVEYLRTYPTTIIAEEPLTDDGLFQRAEDDWWPENLLSQLWWAKTLSFEGGLWVTIGRRAAAA